MKSPSSHSAAVCLTVLLLSAAAIAADYSGQYVIADGGEVMQLTLRQDAAGSVTGELNDDGVVYRLNAEPAEGNLIGAIVAADGSAQYPILAGFGDSPSQLLLKVYVDIDFSGNVIEESAQLFAFSRADAPGALTADRAPVPAPTSSGEQSLRQFLAGKHILFSYREGGAVYGTYYFYNTHHCPSGRYVDYANSHKQSVLGGENRQNWQSNGTWQVTTYQAQIGTYYLSSDGEETFWPMRLNSDGSIYINDTISVVVQGPAQCQ